MKKDLRMVAKSPDPDDLADDQPPDLDVWSREEREDRAHHVQPDHSAPHIPPLQKGRITGEE